MTLNYYIQHKLFNKLLGKFPVDLVKQKIQEGDGEFFTDLIMGAVAFVGQQIQQDTDGIAYTTSIISVGDMKVARCQYTGEAPLKTPECTSIIIAVTSQLYYFTVETSIMGGYMFCGWDDERHLNYGSIQADDPALYAEKIIGAVKN